MDSTTTPQRNIAGPHCQACGSTSAEDIGNLVDTEGYTRCCNERVVSHAPATTPLMYDFSPRTCSADRDCYHD